MGGFEIMENSVLKLIDEIKTELMMEIMGDLNNLIESKTKLRKEFYSLKEVSYITGLSVHAIKGRYRRKTLKVAYEGGTPLIPTEEVERLVNKLKLQN